MADMVEKVAEKPVEEKKVEKLAAVKAAPKKEAVLVYLDTGKFPDALILPKDDTDPRWDARMEKPPEKWLIDSIDEHGVEDPIEVTPAENEGGVKGTYLIDAGRKRVRAIVEVNKRRAKRGEPAIVVPMLVTAMDPEESFFRAIRENEQRENSDPLTKAKGMSRGYDLNKTEEEIASAFRVKVQDVRDHIAILRMPKQVQTWIAEGRLSVKAATELAKLADKEREARLEQLMKAAEFVGSGKRITATAVARTSDEPVRLGSRAIRDLIGKLEELEKEASGKSKERYEAARLTLEAVLDSRRAKGLLGKLEK